MVGITIIFHFLCNLLYKSKVDMKEAKKNDDIFSDSYLLANLDNLTRLYVVLHSFLFSCTIQIVHGKLCAVFKRVFLAF